MADPNIAINKTATATSYVLPYAPSRAVNGNATDPTSRWLCKTVPAAMVVDLGTRYIITGWTVRHMSTAGWATPDYNMVDYALQGSNDNTNWATIDTVVNNTLSVTTNTVLGAYRYVRVYVTKGLRTNPQFASIMELEINGHAPDASLTSLSISSGALTPSFAPAQLTYTAQKVPYSTASVVVSAAATDPTSTIKVNGVAMTGGQSTVNLNVGVNIINVLVTALDGSTKTYTITVERFASSYLSALSAQVGGANMAWTELMPSPFIKTTTSYTYNVGFDAENIKITPTPEEADAIVEIRVNEASVGSGASTVLKVGQNTVTVTVTAAGGTLVTNYTLSITRAGSTYLSAISCTRGPATPAISKNPPYNYTLKAGVTAMTTTITLTAEDAISTTITLQVDANTYSSTNGTLVVPSVPTAPSPGKSVTATVSSSTGAPSTVYTISVIKAN